MANQVLLLSTQTTIIVNSESSQINNLNRK